MENKLLSKTFIWMMFGLLITFITGYIVSINENMLINVFSGVGYILLIILELFLVVFLSARIMKMEPNTAKICFLLYSFVSGLTFSSIFVVYNISSIVYVFLISAVLFGVMSLIGYKTNMDLSKIGTYLIIGLFAIILVSILNILIFHSSGLVFIISVICILLFLGITAHDVQKIRILEKSGLPEENLAIYGALNLYLDFINIFIDLLRLFGDSK